MLGVQDTMDDASLAWQTSFSWWEGRLAEPHTAKPGPGAQLEACVPLGERRRLTDRRGTGGTGSGCRGHVIFKATGSCTCSLGPCGSPSKTPVGALAFCLFHVGLGKPPVDLTLCNAVL